jgi:hypothetical protein
MPSKTAPDPNVFSVETYFQKMARRPGGPPREKVIEVAQSGLNALAPEFNGWLDNKLVELNQIVEEMKAARTLEPAKTEEARARSRALRDVGSTMGFDLVSFIANSLCAILETEGLSADQRLDAIDCSVKALLLASREPYSKLSPSDVPELADGLRRIAAAATAARPGATGTESK